MRSRRPGREAFDLVEDRLAGVAGIAGGDVRVGPDRVDVAARARRVGQVLLADEDEGPLRHPAAVDLALGEDDLLEGADRVHRPRPAGGRVGPGDAALDREVDLEGSRAVPVAAVGAGDPRRQPLAGDLGDRAGREVEDDRVGGRQLVERAHRPAGLDPAAVSRGSPPPGRR